MSDQSTAALDKEWVTLLKEAKEAGLSVEEIRSFLLNEQTRVNFFNQNVLFREQLNS